MSTPTRRPSTGGLPPIKILERYVVEQAPSHDDTPCHTAWVRQEIVAVPEGWSASDFAIADKPPPWSLQIYDTTPRADQPGHLKDLAESLHRETREQREAYCRGLPDRIDVYGMPLAAHTSDDKRVEVCKAHACAEIAFRNTEDASYRIPQLETNWKWRWAIVIVDRPQERWDEDDGGFLAVHWEIQQDYIEYISQGRDENYQGPDISVMRYTRVELGELLAGLRGDM